MTREGVWELVHPESGIRNKNTFDQIGSLIPVNTVQASFSHHASKEARPHIQLRI